MTTTPEIIQIRLTSGAEVVCELGVNDNTSPKVFNQQLVVRNAFVLEMQHTMGYMFFPLFAHVSYKDQSIVLNRTQIEAFTKPSSSVLTYYNKIVDTINKIESDSDMTESVDFTDSDNNVISFNPGGSIH